MHDSETSKASSEFFLPGATLTRKGEGLPSHSFSLTNGTNVIILQAADESSYTKWTVALENYLESNKIAYKGMMTKQGSMIPTMKV